MQDYDRNRGDIKSIIVLFIFRLANFFGLKKREGKKIWILGFPFIIIHRIFVDWLLSIEIHYTCRVGHGLIIHHGQGLVVHPNAIIGNNCLLRHNTTIGVYLRRDKSETNAPTIGSNVSIGCNCIILGDIHIGSNTDIGACVSLNSSIPSNSIVRSNSFNNYYLK